MQNKIRIWTCLHWFTLGLLIGVSLMTSAIWYAVPARGQKQITPVYRTTPLPHWHCPNGYFVPNPDIKPPLIASCTELNAATGKFTRFMGFNANTQEQARWWLIKKIGKDGLLKVDYPMKPRPSCTITGDEHDHIRFLQDTATYSVIKGKPGQDLIFACSLNITREPS